MKAVTSKLIYKASQIREIFPATGYSSDDAMLIFEDGSYHRIRRSIYNTDQPTSEHTMFVLDSEGKHSFLTAEEFYAKYNWEQPCQN